MIKVDDYHKTYETTYAVRGLTFAVEPGQVLGLVGPNGAGKTTTLRALAGIIPPTKGTLSIAGHNLAADPIPAKRALAYVPDDPKLFDALTVWEHLEFIAAAYNVPDFRSKAAALLAEFELTAKSDALGQELSRGMRQKLALCCACLHGPKALLLDEPLTGLDPRAIRTTKDTIRERSASGTAIVISSHMLDLVENLCTHMLILHQGEALYCGAVEEARAACADDGSATLEEVFFLITEGNGTRPAARAGERS